MKIVKSGSLDISPKTIRNVLNKSGYKYLAPKNVRFLRTHHNVRFARLMIIYMSVISI